MFYIAVEYYKILPHEEGALFPPQLVVVEASSEVHGAGSLHLKISIHYQMYSQHVFSASSTARMKNSGFLV
jgi:hypothetical protein